jgi:hypothetical protein
MHVGREVDAVKHGHEYVVVPRYVVLEEADTLASPNTRQ